MKTIEADRAHHAVMIAVKDGRLQRPDVCELCGCSAREQEKLWAIFTGRSGTYKMHGHHYNGYDHPLDVWWICGKCNNTLAGKHDGSLTIDQARERIKPYSLTEDFKMACEIAVTVARKYRGETELKRLEEIGDWILDHLSDGITHRDILSHVVKQYGPF